MDRSRVYSRQQRGELARQGSDLAGKLRVAFARVRDFLILAAAYDLAARGGADVEIGVGGFPDHRGRRPDGAGLRAGRDRPARYDPVYLARDALHHLVARRHDHMAGTDLGTAGAVKRHASFARVDAADHDRRTEPGAAP